MNFKLILIFYCFSLLKVCKGTNNYSHTQKNLHFSIKTCTFAQNFENYGKDTCYR